MDRKFFDGLYIVVPVVISSQIAMSTSEPALRSLGLEVTVINQIIAGSVIGTVVGVAAWLSLVLFARLIGKSDT